MPGTRTITPGRRRRRPGRASTALAALACLLTAGLTGCGTGTPDAPAISVVTTLYPLAQAVAAVGGSAVRVTDLAVAGVDPVTEVPTSAQLAAIRSAALVVDVGGGFQPALERAAASARRVVSMSPRLGSGAEGPWLDPATMQKFDSVLAGALRSANPKAASRYANGAEDYDEQLSSTGIDLESSLSDCSKHDIAAPDSTLGDFARQYGLHLQPVGTSPSPTAAEVSRAAVMISSSGAEVLSEPWVSDTAVRAAVGQSGGKLRTFDTLEAPPAGGWPRGADYLDLLETDLATISAGLNCPSQDATES